MDMHRLMVECSSSSSSLKNDFDTNPPESDSKTDGPTERALIQTRRREIDYREHERHGFVKPMF